MASRYENSNIVEFARRVQSDGKTKLVQRLETTIYPDFDELTQDDTYILSQEGDRLDLLAKEFYGSETLWYVIAKVNGIGHGTLAVPPGKVIRIPYYNDFTSIANQIRRFNQER